MALGINSAVAQGSDKDAACWIVFFSFFCLVIAVNFVIQVGLLKGKQTRIKLINGLLKMYHAQDFVRYYDESMSSNYALRYNLFLFVVVFTGLIALVVPLVMII